MKHRQRLAQATVAVLGLLAAAISYDHIRHLAQTHAETGWTAIAIPLTVDGIEVVATLAVLAPRHHNRAGNRLAWAALIVSTLASIGANIAAAPPDPIARTIAAWPAAAFATAIKLLTTLLDPAHPASEPDTTTRENTASTLRLPRTPRAQQDWNTIWNDHLATGDTASTLAQRHGITARQARTILAAGRAGKLDPPSPTDSAEPPAERAELTCPSDE
ncbi:hypothetical protein Athai_38540 [Actinocatenispora thailandica]|uniref:DUF2637 domain-containing protein n=1 Tax=Actinocatenispora thailandica TaxID=227318 RepID=A0A7R7HY94_9ACTN|nr:DUF2637 domain-containing protein [Actinocatenispora thailandica]BCJ36351.1 hypothetical protein Athai_38540 [Actinocatenispora thailandica]